MTTPTPQDEPRVPVFDNDGKKIGDISLATEYRILLNGMILGAEADIQFVRDRLKELDEVTAADSSSPEANKKAGENAPESEDTPLKDTP